MLVPKIERIATKRLVGNKMLMCLADNKTSVLWHTFMRQQHLIVHRKGTELYAIQCYAEGTDFIHSNPHLLFENWAAVEVESFENIPVTLTGFTLIEGLYAVFNHKGISATIYQTLTNIFTNWLPHSEYEVDNRPHFMIMAEDYSPVDASAEEQVWIPIKIRKV